MMEIGRLVTKTHGRESGMTAIIVDVLDKHTVLIDGNVKRRKCNIAHLEPHSQKFEIKKGASTEEVKRVLEENKLFITGKPGSYKKRERKGSKKPKKGAKRTATAEKKVVKKKAKKSEEEAVEEALKAAES